MEPTPVLPTLSTQRRTEPDLPTRKIHVKDPFVSVPKHTARITLPAVGDSQCTRMLQQRTLELPDRPHPPRITSRAALPRAKQIDREHPRRTPSLELQVIRERRIAVPDRKNVGCFHSLP